VYDRHDCFAERCAALETWAALLLEIEGGERRVAPLQFRRASAEHQSNEQEIFPTDFMMQLTAAKLNALRSQNVTLKPGRGRHRNYLPYAFTEQGVAMLSSVINSDSAIAVNIQIMRAFVQLRGLLASNQELARPTRTSAIWIVDVKGYSHWLGSVVLPRVSLLRIS
jgi:hypothetical protein